MWLIHQYFTLQLIQISAITNVLIYLAKIFPRTVLYLKTIFYKYPYTYIHTNTHYQDIMHMPFQPLLNHVGYLSEYCSESLRQGFFVKWDALAKTKDVAHIFTF